MGLQPLHARFLVSISTMQQALFLFDQICELNEYYPTKTERWILETYVDEISAALGDNIVLIEYGSGSSIKTRLLLEHLNGLAAYVPIDISKKTSDDGRQESGR